MSSLTRPLSRATLCYPLSRPLGWNRGGASLATTLNFGMISHYTAGATDLRDGNDLTAVNTPSTGTGILSSSCISLQAASGQHFSLAHASAGDFEANRDISLILWVNPLNFTDFPRIFSKTSGLNYRAYCNAGGSVTVNWGGTSATTANTLTAGEWGMVYVNWNNTTGVVSVKVDDGVTATGSAGTGAANTDDFMLGFSEEAASNHFEGLMDYVCLYGRALTEDELRSFFNSGRGYDFFRPVSSLTVGGTTVEIGGETFEFLD